MPYQLQQYLDHSFVTHLRLRLSNGCNTLSATLQLSLPHFELAVNVHVQPLHAFSRNLSPPYPGKRKALHANM
jgi:hypothetical protein